MTPFRTWDFTVVLIRGAKLFKIFWQVKYFQSRFYLEILRWTFVWIEGRYENSIIKINDSYNPFLRILNALNSTKILSLERRAAGQVGFKNSKVSISYYFKTNVFSNCKKKCIGSIQFNGKILGCAEGQLKLKHLKLCNFSIAGALS